MRWTQDQLDAYLVKSLAFGDPKTDSSDVGRESDLQVKIERYLTEQGFYFFHDRSRGVNKAGHPDLVIALRDGRVLWIELKQAKGRMSPEQRMVRLKLLALGHEFYEVKSFRGFLGLIK